jgi:hypothetical protein
MKVCARLESGSGEDFWLHSGGSHRRRNGGADHSDSVQGNASARPGPAVTSGQDMLGRQRIELVAMRKDGAQFPVELAITRISRNPQA